MRLPGKTFFFFILLALDAFKDPNKIVLHKFSKSVDIKNLIFSAKFSRAANPSSASWIILNMCTMTVTISKSLFGYDISIVIVHNVWRRVMVWLSFPGFYLQENKRMK